MPCYHPLSAWRTASGAVVFVERGDIVQSLSLPCGRCIGCRLERSRVWAARCVHEAQLHEFNSFITLTYAEAPVSLSYRPFQLFMKRLRKHFPGARFFMCGEYGENLGRAHYHAILFGVSFEDRRVHAKAAGGVYVYTSALLSKLWPYGFSTVGDVTFQSAAYVARYVCKKVTGQAAKDHYTKVDVSSGELIEVMPEFCRMSLKPGIGAEWFKRFKTDVFPHDFVVMNGVPCKVPRFYDKLFERVDGLAFEDVKYARELRGHVLKDDNSPERLAAREVVEEARFSQLKRVI